MEFSNCLNLPASSYPGQGDEIAKCVTYKIHQDVSIKTGYRVLQEDPLLLSCRVREWWVKSPVSSTKCHTRAEPLLSKNHNVTVIVVVIIIIIIIISWLGTMWDKQKVPLCSCVSLW